MLYTRKRAARWLGWVLLLNLLTLGLISLNSPVADAQTAPNPPTFAPDLLNQPTTATARQKFGIAAHPWWLDWYLDKFIAYYKDLGITTVRLPYEWKVIEPKPNEYDWTLNDRLLRRLHAEGFELVLEVITVPVWAAGNPEECASWDFLCYPDNKYEQHMTRLAELSVQRYPFVRYYEFWNEPDYWPNFGSGKIERYGFWLKAFYDGVKKTDPSVLVACTSLSGPEYTHWLYSHAGYNWTYRPFDAVAYHPYTGEKPQPGESLDNYNLIRKAELERLRQIMVENGDGNKPIWITEIGWEATPEQQSVAMQRTFDYLAGLEYVTFVHLHMLHDWESEVYGLISPVEKVYLNRALRADDEFKPKQPFYNAFKFYNKRPLPARPAPTQNMLVFPQTGLTVRDVFKTAWEKGGLALFGYPKTAQFYELNPADGKYYLVQYFERVRMEYHPEFSGTKYEVLYGLLGKQMLAARGWFDAKGLPVAAQVQPGVKPAKLDAGAVWFGETGFVVNAVFFEAWQKNGGLEMLGYPISQAFQEVNPDDGKTYLVQYFERARAEYHPAQNGARATVLYGLLGNELLRNQKRLNKDNQPVLADYFNPALPVFRN
jgi:hypothetical protein